MSTLTRMTADELWQLPQDGMRHELVRGQLTTMPPAGFEHGAVGFNLALPLGQHVKAHNLGLIVAAETGFFLAKGPDTVRAPDIAFVRRERVEATGLPKRYWPGAPDLAVEVVSPQDTVYDVDDKVQEWLDGGAALVWVVNPRRRNVTVYRPGVAPVILSGDDRLEGGEVIGGFAIRVADIFA